MKSSIHWQNTFTSQLIATSGFQVIKKWFNKTANLSTEIKLTNTTQPCI
jgi:hypothetical protein